MTRNPFRDVVLAVFYDNSDRVLIEQETNGGFTPIMEIFYLEKGEDASQHPVIADRDMAIAFARELVRRWNKGDK